ncbi:MAG: divergent polysaccharide deacetylase family protein [Rhodospirillaceae bacterium]|nr:divergent polysaccharide deacetylase family protein [Rhodospirillaceae bacterium]
MADDEADDELDDEALDGDALDGEDGDDADSGDDFDGDDDDDADDDDDFGGDFDDDFDDDDEEGGGGGGKKKIIIIVAAAIVVLGGAAGGAMMLMGGGDDSGGGETNHATNADPNIPLVTMAIPPKRRLKITDESKPKFGARKGGVRKKLKARPDPKPGLTPPATGGHAPGNESGPAPKPAGEHAPKAAAGGAPEQAAAPPRAAAGHGAEEAPREPAKPASTGVRRTPGKGVITPSVTAVAFRGIALQPRGKSLKGVNSEMVESTATGLLPKKTSRGGSPWQEYSRPFNKDVKRPRIAIILRGIGLSRAATLAAINQLPGGVTLAFSPYTTNIGDWMGMARSAGHETLIDLPMEPNDFPVSDPGPMAMLTELEAADNINRLQRLLGLAPGFVGVFQVMGSKFAASEQALTPVLGELAKRGLLYVDNGIPKGGLSLKVAKSLALPRTSVALTLDETPSAAAINGRLIQLEKQARARKSAVGVAEPYPVTIRRLAEWAKSLDFKELALAPVSAVVRIDGAPKKPADAEETKK